MTLRPARLLLVLALAAACARSNAQIIRELEGRSPAHGESAEALLALRDGPVPFAGPARTVTLAMADRLLPTVQGRVNGVEIPMLVDTGTSHLWLSGPAARRVDLTLLPGEARTVVSPGYEESARFGAIRDLGLGEARFGRGAALVSEREQQEFWYRNMPGPEYGILGTSVLGHFRVTFDFARREVRLRPHGGTAAVRPLLAPLEIGGKRYWFLVDSGAAKLFLEPWLARELGLLSARRAVRQETKAPRAEDHVVFRVRVPAVRIADRTFRDVDAGVVHTFGGEAWADGGRPGGLLGLAGFGKLVWTVDFGTKELRIEDA